MGTIWQGQSLFPNDLASPRRSNEPGRVASIASAMESFSNGEANTLIA
jgi:hypothetical protein